MAKEWYRVKEIKDEYGDIVEIVYRRVDYLNKNKQEVKNIMKRVRGFPKAGIKHHVVKLPTYVKTSLTNEEFELVIAYRKHSLEVRKAAYHYLTDKVV